MAQNRSLREVPGNMFDANPHKIIPRFPAYKERLLVDFDEEDQDIELR